MTVGMFRAIVFAALITSAFAGAKLRVISQSSTVVTVERGHSGGGVCNDDAALLG
jgi:hypothetical protein